MFTISKYPFAIFAIFWVILVLGACTQDENSGKSAPLNDKKTLEALAQAYTTLSEQLTVSPATLAPAARKKFVGKVFESAGFNYSATLHSLATVESSEVTQLHKDIMELLFLPHYGTRLEETKSIYTEDEFASIEKITAKIKS